MATFYSSQSQSQSQSRATGRVTFCATSVTGGTLALDPNYSLPVCRSIAK